MLVVTMSTASLLAEHGLYIFPRMLSSHFVFKHILGLTPASIELRMLVVVIPKRWLNLELLLSVMPHMFDAIVLVLAPHVISKD